MFLGLALVLFLGGELLSLDLVDPVVHRILTLLWYPNAEAGSLLRVAAFSFAIFENLLEPGHQDGPHFQAGSDRVTNLSAAVFLSIALCHIF